MRAMMLAAAGAALAVGASVALLWACASKPTHHLSVSASGPGKVTVSGAVFGEATEGHSFVAGVDDGDSVHLKASPAEGFSRWTGDAQGTSAEIDVTVDGSKSIVGHFGAARLDVTVVGGGKVTAGGAAAIDCGSGTTNACSASMGRGETVTLTAAADAGWTFQGWSAPPGGSENPLVLLMDGDRSLTATFVMPTHGLSVTIVGSGRVTGGGLDCRSGQAGTCSATLASGSTVELTATADAGWGFQGWSAPPGGISNPLFLLMDADRSLTATFTETPAYAGTYVFTLAQTFNTCPPNPVVPLESYVVVALPGGTASFTFRARLESPQPPVTFAATTWTPATGHAAGQSAMTTTCPVLVEPSCTACFRLGLDITFDTVSHFKGTLTIDEELALPGCPGSSLCIVRYDIEGTRQ